MKKVSILSAALFLNVNFFAYAEEAERAVNTQILFSEVVLQILATILLILIIKKFFASKIIEMLNERKDHVNDSIKKTDLARNEAIALEEKKSKELNEIKSKTKQMMEESKKEAKVLEEEIVQEAKLKAKNILEKSNKEIESNKKELEGQLSRELANMSVQVAAKFLQENMTDDLEEKLISQALNEVNND